MHSSSNRTLLEFPRVMYNIVYTYAGHVVVTSRIILSHISVGYDMMDNQCSRVYRPYKRGSVTTSTLSITI